MPDKRTGLIQTIGWEALPAVTAALAIRPVALGHVHQSDSAESSRRAERAVRMVLGPMPCVHRAAGFEDPLQEARQSVRDLVDWLRNEHRCERVIVHVTGATKLLAIGAYDTARELGLECLFLELPPNDEDGVPQVISLGTGRLDSEELAALGVDPSARMSIELIACANGYALPSAGLDHRPYLAFARRALEDEDAEEAMQHALPAAGGDRAPWPEESRWVQWCTPFVLPGGLMEEAVAAGIVREVAGGRVALREPGPGCGRPERRAVLERHASLLRGAWLEVALADAMAASSSLRDVRWSVEAELPRPMEHDVIAIKGTKLVVASAKRSLQSGIFGHLRELKAHAGQLGGAMGIPVLAIARTDERRIGRAKAQVRDDLVEVADTLGIRLVGRQAIVKRDIVSLI